MILEEEKYSVETAINAEEAFRRFSLRHYSVFITEYIDPFEDTCRMIQYLREECP